MRQHASVLSNDRRRTPFPIQEDDLHERNRACDAFEEILRGDPQHTDVQAIAIKYGLRVDRHHDNTTRLHPRFENSINAIRSMRIRYCPNGST